MRLKNWITLIIIVFYFGFFVFKDTVILDPDFGWHLQFGRTVLQTHTVPLTDTYSYTMPSYHFVNHEWGFDVLLASLYDRFGMIPVSVILELISVSTLFFLVRGVKDNRWATIFLFLAGGSIVDFTGTRPQLFTWVFSALLIMLLWQKKVWQKWRFFIPILFLVWANLHAGFVMGIFLLGWFVVGDAIEKKRIDTKDSLVLLVSILITLCNPYGYHLWTEVFETVTDQGLHWGIQEWYPAVYFMNLSFWIYVTMSFFLVVRYYRRFSIKIVGLYALLFLSAMSSMRNIPLFVVVSFYPTVQGMTYLYEEAGTHLYGKERFVRGYIGFCIVCLCLYLPQLAMFVYGSMLNQGGESYPTGAVVYLREHLPKGNVFSTYDWGGYLIWKLPEKKVFIDGRMPTWRNPMAPPTESKYAFGDYEKLMGENPQFSRTVKKYNIDTVLIATSDLKEQHIYLFGIDVEKNALLRPFFSPNQSFYPIVTEIKKMGWKKVYQDKTAAIFERESLNKAPRVK